MNKNNIPEPEELNSEILRIISSKKKKGIETLKLLINKTALLQASILAKYVEGCEPDRLKKLYKLFGLAEKLMKKLAQIEAEYNIGKRNEKSNWN